MALELLQVLLVMQLFVFASSLIAASTRHWCMKLTVRFAGTLSRGAAALFRLILRQWSGGQVWLLATPDSIGIYQAQQETVRVPGEPRIEDAATVIIPWIAEQLRCLDDESRLLTDFDGLLEFHAMQFPVVIAGDADVIGDADHCASLMDGLVDKLRRG